MNSIGKAFGSISPVIFTAVSLVISLFFIAAGISMRSSFSKQNKTYTGTTEAVVSDYEVRQEEQIVTDSDGTERTAILDWYYPIFTYTVDGKEYTVTSDTGSGKETYEVNSTVQICYLPSDPEEFYVAGDSTRNFLPYILIAIGAASGIYGIFRFIRSRQTV